MPSNSRKSNEPAAKAADAADDRKGAVGLARAKLSARQKRVCCGLADPPTTAGCDEVDPYSILESHGCLLRRPQKENRRSRRKASNEKERGRPSVRGEPLFSQALREEVSPRKLAFARQSTRPKPEDRRVCQQTAGSRPQGAALRQAPPEMRVPQSTG